MAGKKQHFVPRYYLRGFSKENKLYIYSTIDNTMPIQDSVKIKDIGFKNNFYDVNIDHVNQFLEKRLTDKKELDNIIEEYNERWSSNLIRSFQDLDSRIGEIKLIGEFVSQVAMLDLYDFIVIQLFRTPQFRKSLSDISARIQKLIIESDDIELKDGKLRDSMSIENLNKILHTNLLLASISKTTLGKSLDYSDPFLPQHQIQNELVTSAYEWLKKAYGIMYINTTEVLFKTSDSPVCFTETLGKDAISFKHLYIPLSKRCAFIFMHPILYSKYSHYNRQIRILDGEDDEKIATNFNLYLTKKADKHIYSYDDDFSMESLFIDNQIAMELKVW